MTVLEQGGWSRCPTVVPSSVLCEVLAQSGTITPLPSAGRVLQLMIEEKQMWAVHGNAITLADVEYTRVAAFQHLNYLFLTTSIKMSGQRSDGNSSTYSLRVGRMFKDAFPREKQKSENCTLPDIPRGTKELPFTNICSEGRRQEKQVHHWK